MAKVTVPDHLVFPLEHFGADFVRHVELGTAAFAGSRVAFVGLARNCGTP